MARPCLQPLILAASLAWLAGPLYPARAQEAAAPATETILLIRHGEKPAAGLGQLDCQGLNRALALPAVIRAQFGVPAAIFAPDPAARKPDGTGDYYYVRPLATIEPTAITFGLPVNLAFAYDDIAGLQQALTQPALHGKLVLVAWEHTQLVNLARHLLTSYGADPALAPSWNSHDFDGIYVIHIGAAPGHPAISFSIAHEGLNGLPAQCPKQ